MAARVGLAVGNVGNTPTFRRPGYTQTIPDVTFSTENLSRRIEGWRVIEDYTGSDHQYIVFSLSTRRSSRSIGPIQIQNTGWIVSRLSEDTLAEFIVRGKDTVLETTGNASDVVEATMKFIRRACDESMPRKKGPRTNRVPVYWWSEEIAQLRRACLRLRRRVTRGRRRGGVVTEAELAEFRIARRDLKRAIARSKFASWESLRDDVNNDPWGLGYRVAMRKLRARAPGPVLDAPSMSRIVDALFPTHQTREQHIFEDDPGQIPLFTERELSRATDSMRHRKAPGPDGIPAEVLKVVARVSPQLLLNMYNRCLGEGTFVDRWKVQRLVLISKGKGDPETPSAYRPLCMLDTAGKLLERLLKPRLAQAVEASGGLSDRQYGFRAGRSTVGAVEQVIETFEAAQRGNHRSRPLVMLATLDVRNAFNSARWADMLAALEFTFRVPAYLLRMVQSYLRNRQLIYTTSDGTRSREITAGAAQGSILGPDLWNIAYDGILRMEMPRGSFLVGYADDIAAVITARTLEEVQMLLNQVMRRVLAWMGDHGLGLATEKTEIVLLTRRRIDTIVQVRVDQEVIETKRAVQYLGVKLDTKLTFWEQISSVADKAERVTSSLSRLMNNVGGPVASKRRLLMSITHSVILYGCEVWAGVLSQERYRKKIAAVQRRGALRIASAYRTVSEPAVLVVAGVIPIDLLASERKRLYDGHGAVDRAEARVRTIEAWQERWRNDDRGRWTARLVRDLREWVERESGEVNFYLTQFLTGHGYFRAYLHKMGKVGGPECQYGDSDRDDALHTFFHCRRWEEERSELEVAVGQLSPDTIVRRMVSDRDSFSAVSAYVERVLKKKKSEEEER